MVCGALTDSEIMLVEMREDIASIKTDVIWLKRLFGGILIIVGGLFGVDATGVI